MTVSTAAPISSSLANGLTDDFPYQFRILDAGDLLVTVDGVVQSLGVDYNVSGVGNAGGGNVTFLVGHRPAAGATVTRRRAMPYQRTRAYQIGGELQATELNNDVDATVMMIQQLLQAYVEVLAAIGSDIDQSIIDQTFVFQVGQLRYWIVVKSIPDTTRTLDKAHESALCLCTASVPATMTLRANTGDGAFDFSLGSFLSFSQETVGGQVTIAGGTDVQIVCPAGYLPKTRALGSVITATCKHAYGAGVWILSGDLAIDPDYVAGGAVAKFNKVLAAAHTNSTVTPTTPTGFTANIVAGKSYRVRLLGTYQTAATTTGCIVGILGAGGAAGTVCGRATGAISAGAAATALAGTLNALSGAGATLTTTGVSATNTPHWVEIDVVVVCTTSGTLSAVFASEVAASAAQLNAGAHFSVEEISVTP